MKPFARTTAIRRIARIDVMNNQTGTFTDPQTRLVKKQDQQIITAPKRRPKIDDAKKLADLARGKTEHENLQE